MLKAKKIAAALMCATMAVTSAPVNYMIGNSADCTVENSGVEYDYARALQYSIYFYDANMCGTDVDEHNRLAWRSDCHTYDAHVPMQPWDEKDSKSKGGTNLSQAFMDKYKDILDPDGDGTIDVAGGFHDAGDHVEFGMPENYSAATLGWGYYEFRDSYEKTHQDDHIETILRYFNDYLMKCTFRDKDGTVIAHCYQVGEGGIDHAVWEAPEVDSMVRPAWFLTADKPQTDYVVSACASLAINYLNFKDTDPDYAEKSLDYAKALWKFANDNEKQLSDNADGPRAFYGSSKWEDDWCWAAAWMYKATGDASVFDYAVEIFDYYAPSGWCYCWNDMWSGAATMWAIINQEHPELDLVQKIRDAQGKNQYVFDNFWDDDCLGKCFKTWKALETPGGYAFLNQWGSCRYNTAMQLILMLYDKYTNDGKPGERSEWAAKQMQYIMGNNPLDRCYICGYNEKSVKYPHHRAASGLLMAEDPREQRHVLWGALAGGPDGSDKHRDTTNDWVYNEVTIDYNAAFVGACAGLYHFFGTDDMAPTADFPPVEVVDPNDENSNTGYWVEAIGVDDLNAEGAGVTKVSFKVLSGSSKPSSKISVRYFFDTSEIADIKKVEASELYDQSHAEVEDADGICSGPFKYEGKENTYYVDIAWDGYTIANSGKKYQFKVGFYYGDKWDPKNDWSYDTLKIGKDDDFFAVSDPPEVLNEHICVYDDGVLVGGIEPDGSVPEEQPTTTAAPKVTTTKAATSNKGTTTTVADKVTTVAAETTEVKVTEQQNNDSPEPVNNKVSMYGDANCDNKVTLSDALAILQYVVNETKYPLTEQGLINADCYNPGDGITANDSLAVQRLDTKDIDKLPLIVK